MSMDSAMAQAFSGAAGYDPSLLKEIILSITGGGLLLVLSWIATLLWQQHQDGDLDAAQMWATIVLLAAAITTVLAFLGFY